MLWVLIFSYWNVNEISVLIFAIFVVVLIFSYWNVNCDAPGSAGKELEY